jgi:hypothetical protein
MQPALNPPYINGRLENSYRFRQNNEYINKV